VREALGKEAEVKEGVEAEDSLQWKWKGMVLWRVANQLILSIVVVLL